MISERALTITAKPEPDVELFAVEGPLNFTIILARSLGAGRPHNREQHPGAIVGCLNDGRRLRWHFIRHVIFFGRFLRLLGAATSEGN